MSAELFFIALIAGLILVGAEVFVPGGVIGAMGAIALLIAVVAGWIAFPGFGPYIAAGIVVLVGVAIYLWIRLFPGTRMGRRMTVSNDLQSSKATDDDLPALVGREGVAASVLRPAGFAQIDGRRVDVITRGEMVDRGVTVRVVEVESNRVVVKAVESGQRQPPT